MEFCRHRQTYPGNPTCALAEWLAGRGPIETDEETCHGCERCSHPQDVNEVTISLAGLERKEDGPGTALHKLITWFIPQPENCNCPNRVTVMNAWGWERCRKELPTILGWLRESALDSGRDYSEAVIAAAAKRVLKIPVKKYPAPTETNE